MNLKILARVRRILLGLIPALLFVDGSLDLAHPVCAWGAGKKQPPLDSNSPPWDGRRVISIDPIREIQIEMPDHSVHDFGEDFQASVETDLIESGKYILAQPAPSSTPLAPIPPYASSTPLFPDFAWTGSLYPAASVHVQVDALNFRTGSRGEKTFYGFDEQFRTPFNDGYGTYSNEFPLRLFSDEPSWFGTTFVSKGTWPLDSRAGLDLGDGFQIDVLFAWLNVKYAKYHSELRMTLEIQTPPPSIVTRHPIQVKGDGFFFDVAGQYEAYSAGIAVARTDAMIQVLKKAIHASVAALDRNVSQLPLVARVDALLPNGAVLLGTGPESNIHNGIRYALTDHPEILLEVQSSTDDGSIASVVQGNFADIQPGSIAREILPEQEGEQDESPLHAMGQTMTMQSESIQLPQAIIPQAPLQGLVPLITRAEAFGKSLVEGIFLPYRIWRYFMYDRPYDEQADGIRDGLWLEVEKNFPPDLFTKQPWAQQIGLSTAPAMDLSLQGRFPVVAVIDSGMDYNHPVLHHSLWFNPQPVTAPDGSIDPYGWDFFSEDSRPYDDGYHGTQVSSLVVGVAPHAKILPIKVFNPWGITHSAAIEAAFSYAVDHGADLILCAWSSEIRSLAIERGVRYAQEHGVLVITAAGDDGRLLSAPQSPTANDPALRSETYDNVLVVTGVDSKDQLVRDPNRPANYDPHLVQIAAPGENIWVAEPRLGSSYETSTGLAAAIVAGVVARNLAASNFFGTYSDWIQQLLEDADVVPQLEPAVAHGLRVRVRR